MAIARYLVAVVLGVHVCCAAAAAVQATQITRVTLHPINGGTPRIETLTFGQPFRQGDLPAGRGLRALLDGRAIETQLDRKSSYADGSLRHGIVTLRVPPTPRNGTRVVTLEATDEPPRTESVSLHSLLATPFDAEVALKLDGRRFSLSARRLMQRGRPSMWLNGPLASEWLVGGPVLDDEGHAHPHLAAYFHVRAYAGQPIEKVRVDVVLENGWARVPEPRDYTYDATISVDGVVSYQLAGLTHYHHARWHRVVWERDPPQLQITHDPVYLQASRATPRYEDVHPSAKTLNALPRSPPPPMGNLDLHPKLGSPGAAPWIGPMPRWDTLYAVTGDQRALDAVLAYADAWSSYPVHYRDEKSGTPIDISAPGNAYSGMPAAGQADFPRPTVSGSPYGWKSSHSPPAGFMAYLVTGDYFYLEQLQFVANQNLLQEITVGSKRYPSTWPRVIHSRQVRAQAWTLRTLGLAAAYTPDDDALKPYFAKVLHENMAYMNRLYPANNALGMIVRENVAFNYDTLGPETGFAPWQHNFFTFAVGRLVELGFDEARPIFDFVTRWQRGALNGPDFCWVFAVNYSIGVRPAKDHPLFGSFREVYEANVPAEIRSLGCGTAEMARAIGKPPGAFNDFLDSPTSYQANQQPAVAMMVTLGASGGREAWQLITTRSHRPKFDDYPNYAVVPR